MESKIRAKWQKATMLKRIFIPMFVLVLIESILFFGVIFYNNILSQMEQNTRDIFDSKVVNRSHELENMMVNQWSNLETEAADIQSIISDLAAANKVNPADLDDNVGDSHVILEHVSDNVVSILRNHRVTGAYVFLCSNMGKDCGKESLPGLYISDSNVENDNSITNSDLMIRRGSKSLVEKMGIATDSDWEPNITLRGSNLKEFQEVYDNYHQLQNDTKDIKDLGYWMPMMQMGNDYVVSYVLPIQYRGKVIGVLGIEVSHEYLKSLLNYLELDSDAKGAYSLILENNGKYIDILTNNSYFAVDFKSGDQLTIHQNGDHKYLMQNHDRVALSMEKINLYNNNTPYEKQQWHLSGMMKEDDLLAFTSQIKVVLLYAIIGSLIIGLILSILLSLWISRPVISLANSVRNMTFKDKISIERTKIIEIDQLIDAIEKTGNNAIDAVARFTKIIRLANTQLEGFELDYGKGQLYVTDDFFSAFGLQVDVNQLSIEKFSQLLHQFSDCCRPSNSKSANEYIFNLDVNGKNIYLRLRYIDDEVNRKYYGLVEEVSELMRERQLIEYERDHDVLTGLINRRAYQRQMKRLFTIEAASIKIGELLMLDLDNLKMVNDKYGHEYGDIYIQKAADLFRSLSPEGTIISRISGDEFNLFLYGYESRLELHERIERFWQELTKASVTMPNQQQIHIQVSGGVAWYPDDSRDFNTLQKYSDFAMYSVKHSLKGKIGDFSARDYRNDVFMIKRKSELSRILEENAFTYYFQPIVSTVDGEIYAYEALMRTVNSTLKNPAEIIEIAKMESKLYLIEKITMSNSLKRFHDLIEEGKVPRGMKLFVNSIANQRLSDEEVRSIEEQYGEILPNLVMELTENEELNEEYTAYKKRILQSWNSSLALDDYGSGYNSGRNLLFLNPDYVKIDIDIIRDIDKDMDKRTIVKDTITYCHERGKYVIAEGIETIAELKTVVGMDVDYIQGYLTGRPSPQPQGIYKEIKSEIVNCHRPSLLD